MIRLFILCVILVQLIACEPETDAEHAAGAHDPDAWPALSSPVPINADREARIDELLANMSVEEKVGQLIQGEIKSVTPQDVRDYHLGSVLNGGGSFPGLNKQATPGDWLAMADAYYEASVDTSDGRAAIPIIWGTDSVHGVNNVYGATLFPHNIGLGATRNPELIRRIGEVTAVETAVIGVPWTFAPTLAVVRDDRWGRTYEGYSEDPEIVRSYAGEMVRGLQGEPGSNSHLGDSKVLATAKHFLGDGGTTDGDDQGDNPADDVELFRVHGQGYVTALGAGVRTIMASFNSSRGQKMHGNRFLLTDMLKGKMGFDGFLVGDWNGHAQIPGCSNASCAAAINAGIDMIMVPQDWKAFFENTLEQVASGEISNSRLDDAVRRILRVKMEAGLFESGRPSSRTYAGRAELLGSAENRAVARQAVRESLVLLKNNGQVLPLDRNLDVLVAGAGADDIGRQSGGWTLTWQGTENTNDDFPGATSIYAGIREVVTSAGGKVTLRESGDWTDQPDVAIVVFGETPYAECFGDRRHLNYDPNDPESLALLRKLKADGIPVVSVFLSGRPLWVNPHLNHSDAFVAAWLPGSEGAGVADVLFRGDDGEIAHDFSGKLSFSWPASVDQNVLNVGSAVYAPLFAYGYGLTYADRSEVADDLSTDIGDSTFVHQPIAAGDSCAE